MNIFYNDEEQRLRAGWRIIMQLVFFMLLVWGTLALKDLVVDSSLQLVHSLAVGLAGLASVWLAAILLDRRPLKAYGLSWSPVWRSEVLAGLLIGGLPMIIIFMAEWSAGWVIVTGFGWERASTLPYSLWMGSYLFSMIIIGYYEELIFRGYHILNMTEGLRTTLMSLAQASASAVLLSSVVFGLLHAGNPNATAFSTINIVVAGVVLALPYLITGRLAISIGMHISWNFVQGGIFGFPVSGTFFRGSLIQIRQEGVEWLTGGRFGPEAGLLGLFGIFMMALLFYAYIVWRGKSLTLHISSRYTRLNYSNTDE